MVLQAGKGGRLPIKVLGTRSACIDSRIRALGIYSPPIVQIIRPQR